ncbi:MAG: hypothetical protein P8011_09985 [Acidihalobacter sp.]
MLAGAEAFVGLNLDDKAARQARHRAALMLGPPVTARGGGVSELNSDGQPIQLCHSCRTDGVQTRLICDPAYWIGDGSARFAAQRDALERVAVETGATALLPRCDALIEHHATDRAYTLDTLNRGLIWLGAAVEGPGLAVFIDARALGSDMWGGVTSWLEETLPDCVEARALVTTLSGLATPASIGFEGLDAARGRAKLYWRLNRPELLNRLGHPLLGDPRFAAFLARVVGTRDMNLSGLVFCAGFDLASGVLLDVKIDLCGHCLPQPPDAWQRTLTDLASDHGLVLPPLDAMPDSSTADIAFLGLGLSRTGAVRLNVYLKPPGLPLSSQPLAEVPARIEAAIDFLISAQDEQGGFTEYELPVGRATDWPTAFGGLGLARAAASGHRRHARDSALRAARRLLSGRAYAAGWGFNGATGPDADTTGLVLRLLRALDLPIDTADAAWLRGRWSDRGGFSTYDAPDHWGDVHPCVTAMAWPALDAADRKARATQFDTYLRTWRRGDGTWPAYWWDTDLYSTYHHLRLSPSEKPVPIRLPERPNGFDLAHAAGIEALNGTVQRPILARLLAAQRVDGGWSGGYNLRVTEPHCAAPWDTPEGLIYRDHAGILTTAAALFVLAEIDDDHAIAPCA